MNKAIGYVRVSTQKQDEEQQELAIRRYCSKKYELHDVKKYTVSSRKDDKERGIDELLSSLIENEIDTVICTELSRLGRQMLQVLKILEKFQQHNIKVIFINQPELSTDSKFRDLLVAIFGYFAQTERDFIVERTKQGLEAAKEKGVILGRPKGTYKSKLDKHKELISSCLLKKMSITSIAKLIECSPQLLHKYINKRKKELIPS